MKFGVEFQIDLVLLEVPVEIWNCWKFVLKMGIEFPIHLVLLQLDFIPAAPEIMSNLRPWSTTPFVGLIVGRC